MNSIRDLRLVFFGTPDFAVASLRALLNAGAHVLAVVTAPDKPAGRARQLHETPVKQFAVAKNVPVMQPLKLKDSAFLDALKSLNADLHVVVAFRMLPEAVWNMTPLGTINVHASLLPQYRGAAPINWAIIHGESETGVTTFRLKHEIDTGNILLQQKVPIVPSDDAGSLHDKLMEAGAELLVKTLEGLAENSITPQRQPEAGDLKHAPKIFKEDCRIDWQQPAQQILNFIRGMSPVPGAFTTLHEKTLKIFKAHTRQEEPAGAAPGSFDSDGRHYLRVAACDGWVYLDELQQEGKKRMNVEAFLRGFRL